MNGFPFQSNVTIGATTYNDQAYIGIEKLDNLRKGTGIDPAVVEMANSVAVYAFGNGSDFGKKNFPILTLTQGQRNKKAVKNYEGAIKNKIFGKPKRTSTIAKEITTANKKVGLNNQPFYMIFKDRHFQKNQVISTGGILYTQQVQIDGQPEPASERTFRYKVRVFGKPTDYIDAKYLKKGTVWAEGVVKVSLEHSRGTESRSYNGFTVTNRLSLVRQSINLAGNVANKMMYCKIQADGQTFSFLYDWEKYLTEQQFNANRETDLLISKDNSDEAGYVQNIDSDSGKPVYSGNGLIRQIPTVNIMGYNTLSRNRLNKFFTDSLDIAGNLDQDLSSDVVIDVMCGFGFLQDVDDALKNGLGTLQPISDAGNFLTKNKDGGLQLEGYFTSFRHISGKIIRFTHHNFFDQSPLAAASPKHPKSGRPMTSHEALIMNFGKISNNGNVMPNIEFQYEEGREYYEGTVRGMAKIEGQQGGDISTDIDASSKHMMASQGIHCYTPLSLGYISCKAS